MYKKDSPEKKSEAKNNFLCKFALKRGDNSAKIKKTENS